MDRLIVQAKDLVSSYRSARRSLVENLGYPWRVVFNDLDPHYIIATVDMSDLTGQSILNNICLGGYGNERRTTVGTKKIACIGACTENWQCA